MTTSTQLQLRRGTSAQCAAMTPATAEPIVDTTNKRFRLGDGSTAGGIVIPNFSDIQLQNFFYGTVGGSANAITLTNSPVVLALTTGLRVRFKATSSNTSSTTLAVDGLTAKNVLYMLDGTLTALPANTIKSGGIYECVYDGTQFQLFGIGQATPPSSGSFALLDVQTASASATINVTSKITSSYDIYKILFELLPATNNVRLQLRTSTNNGSSYDSGASNYQMKIEEKDLTDTAAPTITQLASTSMQLSPASVGNGASEGVWGEITLINPLGAVRRKVLKMEGGYTNTKELHLLVNGYRDATSDIDAFQLFMSSGNIASGKVYTYGLKNS